MSNPCNYLKLSGKKTSYVNTIQKKVLITSEFSSLIYFINRNKGKEKKETASKRSFKKMACYFNWCTLIVVKKKEFAIIIIAGVTE